MRVKLVNDFHNTETTVYAKEYHGRHYVTRRQYNRAMRALCPSRSQGCACGGIRGGDYGLELYGEDARVCYQGTGI